MTRIICRQEPVIEHGLLFLFYLVTRCILHVHTDDIRTVIDAVSMVCDRRLCNGRVSVCLSVPSSESSGEFAAARAAGARAQQQRGGGAALYCDPWDEGRRAHLLKEKVSSVIIIIMMRRDCTALFARKFRVDRPGTTP